MLPSPSLLELIAIFLRHAWRPQNMRLYFATGNPLRFRQRINAAAIWLSVAGLISPPIRQALSDNAFNRFLGAHFIIDAQLGAIVLAEIELC